MVDQLFISIVACLPAIKHPPSMFLYLIMLLELGGNFAVNGNNSTDTKENPQQKSAVQDFS